MLLAHGANLTVFLPTLYVHVKGIELQLTKKVCLDNSPLTPGSLGCPSALGTRDPIFSDSPLSARRRQGREGKYMLLKRKLWFRLQNRQREINCGRAAKKNSEEKLEETG